MSLNPFIGEVSTFAFNFAPEGWAICQGQLLPISQNTALFSLIGTTYGGDGRTSFGLPDLRGRSIVGTGDGPGLSHIAWGQRGGAEFHTLHQLEMPAHSHTAVATTTATATLHAERVTATSKNPKNKLFAGSADNIYADRNSNPADDVVMAPESITVQTNTDVTIGNSGSGQSFSLRNPYLGMSVCISLIGIFPPRS